VQNPGNCLYVARLPLTTTESGLRERFSVFGAVADVNIPRNPRSGEGRGFAFITMENDADANAALLALDGKSDGSGPPITVEKVRSLLPLPLPPLR
jgi:transformer-2 protein